jgi:hypothetical protein
MADDSGGGGSSNLTIAVVALAPALVGGVASGVGNYFTFASQDQELKVHLVEIAIGILRADPKEDVSPARGWALDVIEKNSGIPFSNKTERPFCTSRWRTGAGNLSPMGRADCD